MSNTTDVSINEPTIKDEPTVYLNQGSNNGPFSVVDLGPGFWLYIHEASHARAIAAAFTKAADLLDDYAAHQAAPHTGGDR